MNETDWERLVANRKVYCPTCAEDITFDKCDCPADTPEYDDFDSNDYE